MDDSRPLLSSRTLFDLTFHTSKSYEGQDGSFGFQYLVLVPLGLVAILFLRRRPATSAAVVALVAAAALLGSQPVARYLYACLPLMTIAFAAVMAGRPAVAVPIAGCIRIGGYVANGYFLAVGQLLSQGVFPPEALFARGPRTATLMSRCLFAPVIAHYNQTTHPSTAVLLVDEPSVADLKGPVYENSWQPVHYAQRDPPGAQHNQYGSADAKP
jgi:hypothetical protein